MVDGGERLQVLLTQEANNYQTCDYLSRMQGLARAHEAAIEAAAAAEQQCSYSSTNPSEPSSPKKRKSWDDLTSAEESESQHTEQCRRTTATTCASSSGSGSVSVGSSSTTSTSTSQINKHWREKICEWAYQGTTSYRYSLRKFEINSTLPVSVQFISCTIIALLLTPKPVASPVCLDRQCWFPLTVVDHFDLNREVVSTAMSHLDRYLGVYDGIVDKNLFQLLAMTCLYLSIKLNEYKHLLIPGSKSSMDTILQLSRGFFTLKEMEQMEYEVLQRLRWHVHPPTAQLFVKHFLFFLSAEEHELHDLAQFMIELSVMDYFFVSYKPSEIAMAALLNCMDRLGKNASEVKFPITRFIDIQSPAIIACRERLSLIYAQANEQGGLDDSEVTPARSETTTEVPQPARLQRTISPVSVMAPPEPNDNTGQFGYASMPQNTCQTQQFDSEGEHNMETEDYYLGGYDDSLCEAR